MVDRISVTPPFTLPFPARPSTRYRSRFNEVAKQLKIDAEWVKDDKFCLVVDADELKGNPSAADIKRILDEVEAQRLKAVEASALLHKRIPYRAPLENLNKAEQWAVELFATKVKPVLNKIESRQHDPHALELGAWMVHHGDHYSKLLFSRFHRDSCAGIQYMKDKACSLFPFYPDQPPLNGMIDPAITAEEFKELGKKLPPDAEELRPTTLLTKDGAGKVQSTPLPLHPDFKQDHLELAEALEEIADIKVAGDRLDSKTQDQLKKWARFFRTGSAKDEAQAVQATIDAGEGKGNLRTHIGPSESYWDDTTKFPYVLQVGIRDPKLSKELAKGAKTFLEMEASVKEIPHCSPRKLSTRGGFTDPMYQAVTGGFLETYPVTEPAGNNFPNYSYPNVEGSNRFILSEVVQVAGERLKTVLNRLLDEDVSHWDGGLAFVSFVADHESGHLLTPQRDHITPSGERMGAVFGEHWGSADEPRADLTAVEKVRLQSMKGEISSQDALDLLRVEVARDWSKGYLGKAAFFAGKTQSHSYGKLIKVGLRFQTGVYSLVTVQKEGKSERRLHVDYRRLMETSSELQKKIKTFQCAGDLAGFQKMSQELVKHIPDEADKMILEANKDQPWVFMERHL